MVLYVVHSFTLLFLVLRYQDFPEDTPDLMSESGSESGSESDEGDPAEGIGLPAEEAFGNMLRRQMLWMQRAIDMSVGGSEE
jgi:hypothetical protein